MRWGTFIFLCLIVANGNAAETDLLEKYPKLFGRNKNTLVIQVDSGKSMREFPNELGVGASYLKTTIQDYFPPLNLVLLHHQYYENSSYKLLSLDSGKELNIPTIPVWSPDGKQFAIANDDESEYTENVFLVGKCDRSACMKLFERKTRSGDVKWRNGKTVEVQIRKYNSLGVDLESSKQLNCMVNENSVSCSE